MSLIKKLKLIKKVSQSEKVIEKTLLKFSHKSTAVAWTGGKDSTVLLWIVLGVCKEKRLDIPNILFINEGDVFPEIKSFVQTVSGLWDLEVHTVQNDDVLKQAKRLGSTIYLKKLSPRNRKEVERLGFDKPNFPFEPESFVGNHLMKTVPMNMFIESNRVKALITGIRLDEQEARSKETYFSPRTSPDHIRIHPLLHFTEQDIWDAIHTFQIPFVDLYKKGYRSLGAKSTTGKVSDIPAWQQDLAHTKERDGRRQDKEKIMEKLRKLGYM